MPTPSTLDIWQEQQTKYTVPLDCFKVCFGYQDRDQIQIRLERETVLLFDDRESRRFGEDRLVVAEIPFLLFAREWPQFLIYLRAKAAEEGKGDGA